MLDKNLILDQEEQALEKALENNEFESLGDNIEDKKLFEEAVKNFQHLKKSKRITIRINQLDLVKVKAVAIASKTKAEIKIP